MPRLVTNHMTLTNLPRLSIHFTTHYYNITRLAIVWDSTCTQLMVLIHPY